MEQVELLRFVLGVLEQQGIVYMLGGSLASGMYGEARATHDIDLVVDLRAEQVNPLCAAFSEEEFYVSVETARREVTRGGQFNVVHFSSGNKIDFILPRRDDWGQLQLKRRREEWILPELRGYVASPEDVILAKMWYYQVGESEKHLRDIAAMLKVSGDEIDRAYVDQWAEQLGFGEIWRAVLQRVA